MDGHLIETHAKTTDHADRALTDALAPIYGTPHARTRLASILADVVAYVATEEGADASSTATALGILPHLAHLADAHEASIPDAKGTRRFADALALREELARSSFACMRLAANFASVIVDREITNGPCTDTTLAVLLRHALHEADGVAIVEDVLHHAAQSQH